MKSTEKEILDIACKIMKDIKFDYDKTDQIKIVFDEGKMYKNRNVWQVRFPFGKEYFGRNIGAILQISDDTKRGIDLVLRHGSIKLTYDENKDKYFRKENP